VYGSQVEIKGVKAAAHHTGPVIDPDERNGGGEQAEKVGRAALELIFIWTEPIWLAAYHLAVLKS
jgi:hypothetical protein